MKKPFIILLGLILVLVLCYIALQRRGRSDFADHSPDDELTLYCAAGLRNPVSKIIEQYSEETGCTVNIIYNGSGALLSQIQLAQGDLYLPANISYVRDAQELGLAEEETIPVAVLTAKIIVSKNNTKIQCIDDLTKPGVRLSFANKSAAIGKFTREVLAEDGMLSKIETNITVTKPTVNNIIEDVMLGSVDATIAWDAVAANFPELRTIEVPIFTAKKREACVTLLTTSKNSAKALHLARYIAAKDKGQMSFKAAGFATPDISDRWTETPELLAFSGAMLKPAIDKRIQEFEKREGCKVTTVYEGCGTLISQMLAGAKPSFYFSCDKTYLDHAQDRFTEGTTVPPDEIILLVPQSNPKQLVSLKDLTTKQAKIAIASSTKYAFGAVTYKMLITNGVLQALEQSNNSMVLDRKGDVLVAQMQAGALDAALLYRSHAMANPSLMEHCDIISISRQDAITLQTFATANETPYPRQIQRLGNFLTNDDGKKNFLNHGFTWEKD
ncbi:MAG: substrate-binding domain-containing protein [Rubritalea sp.]|uniref:substrate-binding domain-containing protein n=1 Tax=Rubritalea sp. TaxID=2109375 RepID=UPI0032423D47